MPTFSSTFRGALEAERSIASAQQNVEVIYPDTKAAAVVADSLGPPHGEVELAVAVEVPRGEEDRSLTFFRQGEVLGRLEGAVAVAQQHAEVIGVRGHEVELAVAVEVADRHRPRAGGGAGAAGGLKGAVAVAQAHAYRAAGG